MGLWPVGAARAVGVFHERHGPHGLGTEPDRGIHRFAQPRLVVLAPRPDANLVDATARLADGRRGAVFGCGGGGLYKKKAPGVTTQCFLIYRVW